MRVQPIVEILDGLKAFAQVDGALAFADLENMFKVAPAAFVIPTGERAGENRLVGALDQRVAVEFSVVLILSASQRRRGDVPETLHDRASEVIDAITGQTHPDMKQANEYVGGKLINVTAGHVFWQITFSTVYHLRKA